jgi:hypothetical protein
MTKNKYFKSPNRGIICEKPVARSSRRRPPENSIEWKTLNALKDNHHFGLYADKNDAVVKVDISPALQKKHGREEYGVIATRLIKKGEVITM